MIVLLLVGCSSEEAGSPVGAPDVPDAPSGEGGGPGEKDPPAPGSPEALYPTPKALYERAIARSCAGPAGSCHTGWAPPELSSFEAFLTTAGAFCQEAVGDRRGVVDGCERPGDRLVFADGVERTIVQVELPEGAPSIPTEVTVTLDGPAGDLRSARRVRDAVTSGQEGFSEELRGVTLRPSSDPARVALDLAAAPGELAKAFDVRRWPRRGRDVIVADENGNGRVSAEGALRQIVPGKPEHSYLYLRLLNDRLGARMPLIDTGWPSQATRALFCFVRGLPADWQPDVQIGSTPIPYDACPQDDGGGADPPDYAAVQEILTQRCAAGACHGASRAAELDLRETAFSMGGVIGQASHQRSDWTLIVKGEPEKSYLFCKIDPACEERADGTALMPMGAALDEASREVIRRWISEGAKLE